MATRRLSAWLVTVPPFAWIALFLFVPYCLLFCYSFWSLDANQQVLRHWTLANYRRMLYQAVIIPLWISYLVRAYAWKVIFGNEGVMNTLLQWCHATSHPLGFLLYSPFAVIVTLTH